MNPTKPKTTHPVFQNKPQPPKPVTPSKPHSDDKETYAKKKVQEAFRNALKVWHTNPTYRGKEYKQCAKVVAEMFPSLPAEDF
ncbi:hypothetical protein COU78_04975 [Candidatus Peregrinibacteria bacterium CG10_big_fil_rev_8_21_14_0_10_49_24]|nr:MAG: hypothetical protein COU78_04975 [Candidatus Peregrinibacteria bacterium CG10_big_fil_rev_8_21_14_0_10_49_24]